MSGYQWTTQDYVYVTSECVTGVLSVLGNGLVLLAIAKTRALRTPTNCFIGSLAAADMLVGFVIPPTVVLPYLGLPHHFYGCVLVNSLVVLITNISILSLLSVALERFLAISDPFRYQRVMTVRRALAVVGATWVLAILIALIPTMGWNLGNHNFTRCSFTGVIDMKYMVYLIFFGVNLPPLFAMLIIYLYIFHIVRQQQQRMAAQLSSLSLESRSSDSQHKREVRGAKGLAYVIILFAVCWMPLHIMNCFSFFAPQKAAPAGWLLAAIVLSHANSFINPFLYAFSNSQFKRAMYRIVSCGRLRSPYVSESSEVTMKNRYARKSLAGRSSGVNTPSPLPSPVTSGHASLETLHESLSSEEWDRGKHGSRVTSLVMSNGVANSSIDVNNKATSPKAGRTHLYVKGMSQAARSRNEMVEAIPSLFDHSPQVVPPSKDSDGEVVDVHEEPVVSVTVESNGRYSPVCHHNHNGVWVTPSSLSVDQELEKPAPDLLQAFALPSSSHPEQVEGPSQDSLEHTVSDHRQKDIFHSTTDELTEVNISSEQTTSECVVDSTRTETNQQNNYETAKDDSGELSAIYVNLKDNLYTVHDLDSKAFVSVRL